MKLVRDPEPFTALFPHGMVLKDGEMMSKSKGNTVSADEIVARYGCDTVRGYLMFAAPPEKDMEWSDTGIEGIARFLKRVERLVDAHRAALKVHPYSLQDLVPANDTERALRHKTHQAVMRVTHDTGGAFHFNTALSALMEFSNALSDLVEDGVDAGGGRGASFAIKRLILLLAPFAPHLAEEWWERAGEHPSVFEAGWPRYSAELAAGDVVEVVVQVNGKVRSSLQVAKGLPEADLKTKVLADHKIRSLLDGKTIRRWIVVPDKLVNLVI